MRYAMKSAFLSVTRFVANRCNSLLFRLIAPRDSRLKTHSSRRPTEDFRLIQYYGQTTCVFYTDSVVFLIHTEIFSLLFECRVKPTNSKDSM